MATFAAGPNGIDMNTLALPNTVTGMSIMPSQITTNLQNGAVEYYDGSFFAPSGTLSSGTATSYQRVFTNMGSGGGGGAYGYGGYTPGVTTTVFSITGANVSAAQVNQDLSSPNSTNLLHSFLTGHDTYIGSSTTDVLIGQGGNDTFQGGSGTETFIPAAGANTVVGGSGQDMVVLQGPSAAYTIANNGDGTITVTDSVASRNGTDHLANVQFVQFTDRMQIVATPGSEAQIALLYQGALGRIPDAPGLTSWENIFNNESASARAADNFTSLAGTSVSGLPNLASGFTQSTEFQHKYGSLSDTQFVTQLYANVLDRAPDTPGLNTWLDALGAGHHTREWVLVGFAESDEALHNAEVGFVGQSGAHPGWLSVV